MKAEDAEPQRNLSFQDSKSKVSLSCCVVTAAQAGARQIGNSEEGISNGEVEVEKV